MELKFDRIELRCTAYIKVFAFVYDDYWLPATPQ